MTTFTKPNWIKVFTLLALLVAAKTSQAQEGSQGNTTIFGGAQMTFFGAHTFVSAGTGTQPGIIKTIRTAPIGIVNYSTSASHTASSNTSHVDGYVGKYGTTAFTFPVGNGTKLRPVSISAPSSGDFKAAYWFSNPNTSTLPAGAPFLVANLGSGVAAVSNLEYWDVDGPSAINLTLSWDAASALSSLVEGVATNLVIVGYNTSTNKWENVGNAGGTTGTLTTTGTVTANGIIPNNYSAFTFGAARLITTPDLRPYTVITNVDFNPTDVSRPFTARIRNVRSETIASDPVIVRIYKPTPGSVLTLSGVAATDWTIVNSGTYYTLTTNVDIPSSPLGYAITANVTIPAATAAGTYPLRVFIPDLSGGEVLDDNRNNNLIVQLYKN
jgi:hypothetical protein